VRLVPLSEAVAVNPKIDRTQLADGTQVSFVPMAAVGAADGSIDTSTVRPYVEVKKGYTHFRENDVLFAKVTPCMENGKMAVARKLKNGMGFGSTEFHVLRPREGVDPQYVYHFVSSQTFRKEAAQHMTGAVGLRRVPSAFLESAEIPLPAFDVQREIVAELEKQFSRLDEAVANLQRVKANLKRYKASVLNEFFDSKASGWRKCQIKVVCQVISGFAFKSTDFSSEGVPVVKIANIGYGEFHWKDQEYLPSSFLESQRAFAIQPCDLLMALTRPITNGTLKVCLYPHDGPVALLNQRVAVLRVGVDLEREFLLLMMQSAAFKNQLQDALSETLQPNLSPVDLKNFEISIPPGPEQSRIVAEVDRHLSIIREVEAEVDANLQRAQVLRQATLRRVFFVT
jgi:type I restriction enzyme, S subunit